MHQSEFGPNSPGLELEGDDRFAVRLSQVDDSPREEQVARSRYFPVNANMIEFE